LYIVYPNFAHPKGRAHGSERLVAELLPRETPDPTRVMVDEVAVGQDDSGSGTGRSGSGTGFSFRYFCFPPIAVVARSKVSVCGRSLDHDWTVGSNPTDGMDVCLL
jgi:hypothetical protein